jgi:predicted Zn-dependent peptidase
LNYNKPVDIDAVFKQLDAITPSDILEVANEILDSKKISSLLYNPEEAD